MKESINVKCEDTYQPTRTTREDELVHQVEAHASTIQNMSTKEQGFNHFDLPRDCKYKSSQPQN